ncbi:MAG: ankyrin repeat domain-containing protein, partial [Chitinophagaceae bacterium]
MNIYQIEQAYIQGKDLAEINELYKTEIADATEEQQIEVWEQVCGFANAEMVSHLLEQGWRVAGLEDREGNTVLHFLAKPARTYDYFIPDEAIYNCTKLLLEAKVSPLRKNSEGNTALMLGARIGYYKMLEAYQEISAKIDFADRKGNTLLHICAEYAKGIFDDYTNALEKLTIHQNNPDFNAENQRQAQERAQLEWRFNINRERFNYCISFAYTAMEYGIDPHQKNNERETSIDVAIRYGAKSIGAILKGVDYEDKETVPLYFDAGGMDIYQACAKNDLEALTALIKLGENVNEAYDKENDKHNGMTPLAIAMMEHRFEITDLLLKNGADATLRDSKSWHPFRYLFTPHSSVNTNFERFKEKTFQKILKDYIGAGFDINSLLDDEENTLLTISASYGDRLMLYNSNTISSVMVDEAVYSGADVNQTNRDGVSALMYLCLVGSERAEKNLITLLEQGASTELSDKNGKTALMYA